MRPLSRPFSLRSTLALSCALLAACLLGACDEHTPTVVPEKYGHGSSHDISYDNHQIDSKADSRSFSDTRGIDPDQASAEGTGKTEEPGGTPRKSPEVP